jgi:hypothetical protein
MARKSRVPTDISVTEGVVNTPVATDIINIRNKALVFVSHDSRDNEIAESFANLLSDVSVGTLKTFRSSDNAGTSGIAFGDEWLVARLTR